MGYSSFAKQLQASDTLPDPIERDQIVAKLLAELEDDKILPVIWAHAGYAATGAYRPKGAWPANPD